MLKMKGSEFEDSADRTCLQYSLYHLENIPEANYLRNEEEEARDNGNIKMLNFIILPFNYKFRIADK